MERSHTIRPPDRRLTQGRAGVPHAAPRRPILALAADEVGLGLADRLGQEVGGGADAGDVAQVLVDGEPVGADGAQLGQDADEVGVAGEIVVQHADAGAGADRLDLADGAA